MSHETKLSILAKMNADKAVSKDIQAMAKMAPSKGAGNYQAGRVSRFVKKSGVTVLPNEDGVFIPKDAEEEEMLEYYAERGLVTHI